MAKEVRTTYMVNDFMLCPKCYRKHLVMRTLKWLLIVGVILGTFFFLLG